MGRMNWETKVEIINNDQGWYSIDYSLFPLKILFCNWFLSLSRTEQNNEKIRSWEEVYLIEDKRAKKGIGGIKED